MIDILGIILTALLSALVGAAGGNWLLNRQTATKTEVSYLREIIEELRKERDCDREEITALTGNVSSLKATLQTESDGKELDRKTIITLSGQVAALQKELDDERARRREIEAAKDKRIDDLQAEVEELQKQVKELGGTPRKRKATGNLVP